MSPFHTCPVNLKLSRHYADIMWEGKCPNQLNWISNWLHPASSLQRQCDVRLSPCVNKAENSQRASGHVKDVSILRLMRNHFRMKKKVIYMKTATRDDEIRELLLARAEAKIVRRIQGTARDSVVYDQIAKPATWLQRDPCHALPPARSTQAPPLA